MAKSTTVINTPQTIVIKAGGSSAANWITAACAVTTLVVVSAAAKEVSDKIANTSEKIEKTKDAMTFKSTRTNIKEAQNKLRNRFSKKVQ